MDKPKIETVTIEEAVARILNLDVIRNNPDYYEIFDTLEITRDWLKGHYQSALKRNESQEYLELLKLRWIASEERIRFAASLHELLQQEAKCQEHSLIKVVDQAEGRPLLNAAKVSKWADSQFRAKITDWKNVRATLKKIVRWEDCEIRIHRKFRVSLLNEGLFQKHLKFQDVDDLWRKKSSSPSKAGEILIWLSRKKPTSSFTSDGSHGTKHGVIPKDMTKLRKVLKKLTGLSSDPFFDLREDGNYIPRFKIADYTRKRDTQIPFDEYIDDLAQGEASNFEEENDEAGNIIRKARR